MCLGPHLHPLREEREITRKAYCQGTGMHRARVTGFPVSNIIINIPTGFHGALSWDLKGFTSQTAVPEQLPT